MIHSGTIMKTSVTTSEIASFGFEARRLRTACVLTQQKLAELAGVPREHVDCLEHNYPVPLNSKRLIFQELWALNKKK